MEKWTFRNSTLLLLEEKFGLILENTLPSLDDWLAVENENLSENEKNSLLPFQSFLQEKVDDWNEQELSMHFIGPIFSLLRFSSKKYGSFAGRELTGIVGDVEFSGKPDEMIASGRLEPKIPYFFLQEYKQESDPSGDPRAQVLAAMLVAQTKNNNNLPIYGGYVKGRMWYFMVLEGGNYAKSRAYDATEDDIFDIFKILKKLKTIIELRLP